MRTLMMVLVTALICDPVFAAATVVEKKPSAAAQTAKSSEKPKGQFILTSNTVFKPDRIALAAKPGEVLTQKIVVQNDTNVFLEAELQVFDMYTDRFSKVILPKQKKKHKASEMIKQASLGTNIIIPEKIIKLQPKEVKTYTITIKIPEDAKGSYYFVYTVQPLAKYNKDILGGGLKKDGEKKKATLGMIMSVYSLGVVWIKDKEDMSVQVQVKNSYNSTIKQLQVASEIKNVGDAYYRNLKSTAVILNADKKVVGKFELLQKGKALILMPQTARQFVGVVNAELAKGSYQIVLTYEDENKKLMHSEVSELKVN